MTVAGYSIGQEIFTTEAQRHEELGVEPQAPRFCARRFSVSLGTSTGPFRKSGFSVSLCLGGENSSSDRG
jgi:hypothetical protein